MGGGAPIDERDVRPRGSWVRRAWWLHPPLLAAFPVLFLFAANIGEQITLDPLIEPLALAVGGGVGLLAVLALAFRALGLAASRAALVASLAIAAFFGYGHVWQAVSEIVRLHRYLLAAFGAVALVALVVIIRARPARIGLATGVLNFAATVLVVVNVVPIVGFALRVSAPAEGVAAPTAEPSDADPDIWYLVFDRYGGPPSLEDAYGFDNRDFLTALEGLGYIVFEDATANYLKTAHSLASTLEMDYLDADAYRAQAADPGDWNPLYRTLQGTHAVERYVHGRGYEYLHLGVRRGATYTNSAADREYLYTDQTEFSAVLLETTLLIALESLGGSEALGGTAELYRNHSLYQLNVLEQLATIDSERPRFIFAHLLLPHPPYVFNADGTSVTAEQAEGRTPNEQYLEQLQYTNVRILQLLEAIERSPGVPPVVVLQADEGPFPQRYARDEFAFEWTEATDAELVQKFSILSAYRVPGTSPEGLGLTDSMTAVNAFRAVFNAIFDAELALLPDRNFIFPDQRHIYDLRDITARLREAMERRR